MKPLLIFLFLFFIIEGCRDESNVDHSISGVLLDIRDNKPIANCLIVLRTGTGIDGMSPNSPYGCSFSDQHVDSIMTDMAGNFRFDSVNPSHTVYKLIPKKIDFISADLRLLPIVYKITPLVYDTLLVGVKASIKLRLSPKDSNRKIIQVRTFFRTVPSLQIFNVEQISNDYRKDPLEFKRDYLYDINNQIKMQINWTDSIGHFEEFRTVDLKEKEVKDIEIKY